MANDYGRARHRTPSAVKQLSTPGLVSANCDQAEQQEFLPNNNQSRKGKISSPDFLQYLKSRFVGASGECLHATYCDQQEDYLHDEILVEGSTDLVATRARVLFSRALAVGASGLLLAHNHPSGRCRPSRNDVSATDRMRQIAAALDISLLDHLILAHDQVYSMRSGKYL